MFNTAKYTRCYSHSQIEHPNQVKGFVKTVIPNYCDPKCNVQHCASPFLQLQVGPQVRQKICAALSEAQKHNLLAGDSLWCHYWLLHLKLASRAWHNAYRTQYLVPHLGNHGYISNLRRSLLGHPLVVDEKIPPFYVKRFEYPEKRYINLRNDYYYYYSVFVCIRAPVLLGLLFPAFGWTSHWTFASTSLDVTLGYLELLLLPYSEIIIHCFFTSLLDFWLRDKYIWHFFRIKSFRG